METNMLADATRLHTAIGWLGQGTFPWYDGQGLGPYRFRTAKRSQYLRLPYQAVVGKECDTPRELIAESIRMTTPDCLTPPGAVFHKPILADLRGESITEGLLEAAARDGIPFLSTVRDLDGREKVVLQAAPPAMVSRFLAGEIVPDLVDAYGDPARGFAGGYLR